MRPRPTYALPSYPSAAPGAHLHLLQRARAARTTCPTPGVTRDPPAHADRSRTPLFGPAPGEEFTHHQLDSALELLLTEGAQVPESELHNYSVHSFRIFAACALLAANCPRWLIKRLLRWRGDESLEIYARVNNADWAIWTSKLLDVTVKSSIASRLTYMDFSEETQQRFSSVAKAVLSVGHGRRAAADAL